MFRDDSGKGLDKISPIPSTYCSPDYQQKEVKDSKNCFSEKKLAQAQKRASITLIQTTRQFFFTQQKKIKSDESLHLIKTMLDYLLDRSFLPFLMFPLHTVGQGGSQGAKTPVLHKAHKRGSTINMSGPNFVLEGVSPPNSGTLSFPVVLPTL